MNRWIYGTLLLVSLLGAGSWLTAVAQDAPTAGPVRAFEAEKGRVIGLSPDGTKYAVYNLNTELCVFDAATLDQVSCASFENTRISVRPEDIVWSPDSTRLAFAEQAFMFGDDGDLWVMDAASGGLTNITDDGYSGGLFGFSEPLTATFSVDVAPAWTPDSQFITYSRSNWIEGERGSNDIAQVPAIGGTVETLTKVSVDAPGVVYLGTGWAPDGQTFYYTLIDYDADNPDNGIWVYDKVTGESAKFAVAETPDLGPLALLDVSPAGDKLLAWYPQAFAKFMGAKQVLRLIDVATGAITQVEHPIESANDPPGLTSAGFSPDGSALLQLVDPGEQERQLWVTDFATGEHVLVVEGLEGATIDPFMTQVWGANGTVLVARGIGAGYLTSIEGFGVNGAATTTAVDPAASPVAAVFAAGTEAVTAELTPVFAAPDPNAAVVLLLVPNQTVLIVSDPVENEFGLWYPVVDPDTQSIGYVQANRLGTSS